MQYIDRSSDENLLTANNVFNEWYVFFEVHCSECLQ